MKKLLTITLVSLVAIVAFGFAIASPSSASEENKQLAVKHGIDKAGYTETTGW